MNNSSTTAKSKKIRIAAPQMREMIETDVPSLDENDDTSEMSSPNFVYEDQNHKELPEIGISSTPINLAYDTPTHRQPTPSKFVFLSDQKSVPTDLKKLQERTIKRRRDFVARMHDLVSVSSC